MQLLLLYDHDLLNVDMPARNERIAYCRSISCQKITALQPTFLSTYLTVTVYLESA